MIILSDYPGNNVVLFTLVVIVGIILVVYIWPWYRLMRMHIDGWDKDNYKESEKYKEARAFAIFEIVVTIGGLFIYYFDKVVLPWYIFAKADPFELLVCIILTVIAMLIILTAVRSKKISSGERWFVVTAVLCILMLAWCETLIPWAH